jgi:16S rRNA (guanine1207-N2)-methyltransferase
MKFQPLLETLRPKIHPPLAVALGSLRETAELLAALESEPTVCYQMDLYQAERLREELAARQRADQVTAAADLWDLPAHFQTVLYPAAKGSERFLKVDMVEQAFHLLRPCGNLLVWSPYENDRLFPELLKKVFGRHHAVQTDEGTLCWSSRQKDLPRRRHEMTFHARIGAGPSLTFLSRPGVFSYGRMDDGARALVEVMTIEPGDRILDFGCGCGTNGVFAGLRSGPSGHVTFVDSNLRAVALAEYNARTQGLPSFTTVAARCGEGLPEGGLDVMLANPPYYAQHSIAAMFIERARTLLRPGGRMYLVTRQADQVGPLVADAFGRADVAERRGYVVLCAEAPKIL